MKSNEPTIAQLMELFGSLPTDATVGAYEGEGGSWLLVSDNAGELIVEINTGTGETVRHPAAKEKSK